MNLQKRQLLPKTISEELFTIESAIAFINRSKNKYYFDDFKICILSGISIYLWPFAPTGNVFNNWINIALILNLPFLIWNKKLYG